MAALRNTVLRGAGAMLLAALLAAGPAGAQMQTIDPDRAIDADITGPRSAPAPAPTQTPSGPAYDPAPATMTDPSQPVVPAPSASGNTYRKDDLIGAAEGVFGKGAEGLAGREGGGAFVVGVRYGSGTLHHKVEGTKPVYWTGPSIGLDAGANAGNAFVLVYNLYDTEDLYKRYAAGEGQAYLVGGFHVSYLRRKDVVLIPVRMGAGLRLGANVGYMKFSHNQNWMPF